jgi:capsular exopolysaccharide synthesis family protein
MSKNFELMQQAEIRLDIPATVEPNRGPRMPNGAGNGHARSVHFNLDSVAREESLKLVQSVFLLKGKESPRVVIFAGIDSGSGCSGICAHAAEILASQNLGTVCLVDANLRSPSLPEFFGVTNHHGLTDALRKNDSIRTFAKPVHRDNLFLLSCGSLAAESASLLNSDVMKARVAELRKEFDYVLIDSPPLNTYADGVAVGQLADGLVLVLEANSTRREAAARVADSLRAAHIRILGAVLNKRTFPIPESLYNLL